MIGLYIILAILLEGTIALHMQPHCGIVKDERLPQWSRWSPEIDEYMNSSSLAVTPEPPFELERQICHTQLCPVCNLSGHSAPLLFVHSRNDGLGARAQSIAASMAIAAKHKLNFGGAFVDENKVIQHGVNTSSIMTELFGSDLYEARCMPTKTIKIEFPNHAPRPIGDFANVGDMERFFQDGKQIPQGHHVFLKDDCVACHLDNRFRGHSSRERYNTSFLEAFRHASSLTTHPQSLTPRDRPLVAMHIRRGDVKRGDPRQAIRFTPDELYYMLASKILEQLPNADIHVFSQGGNEEFDGYKKRGMKLHLNTDVIEAWRYFANADVMIAAKSSFSFVPALLNTGCVIYQNFWHTPLDEWMVIDWRTPLNESMINDTDLKDCLR
eukprot:gnl/TRDRNA2_/TRDRNA2_172823_c0_seq8.p1 gnl/TRDRNA2_/TRDRNA2_172823_c0~~gnl/TRDRNA2_/TRDRNA2_172823_c0_seq8.p1  ORF type:complete len:383 (+),score=24.18 gnl/TRDRNA2_/TRDRNA2_172823_c0_seq8:63-1211(+)